MGKPSLRVLIAESFGFSPEAVATVRRVGEVVLADLDRPGLLAAVTGADVLWVRLRHAIDAEVLDRGVRLSYIVTPTTGLNHIDLAAAEHRGIEVLSLRGEREFLRNVRATAEHTVGMMLALLRHIPAAARQVVEGRWDRDAFWGRELFGKTAGIIGFGRIGQQVARCLLAFGMRVLATDPSPQPSIDLPAVPMVPLLTLLREADVVTLHASYVEQNLRFFGERELAAMKPRAIFVNTARGELVDEPALLSALESGRLLGAALDVLSEERSTAIADQPLVRYAQTHDNLLITPHIGGCTAESMRKTEEFLAARLATACRAAGPFRRGVAASARVQSS